MTPTEKLIAEARELCSRKVYPNGSTALMRPIIIRLCDALEETQKTIEQTWEWDMYKCAQREIDRLRKELEQAQNAQRWIPVEERLPEVGDTVLAHIMHSLAVYGRDDGFRAYRVYEYDGRFIGMGNLCAVTHWMPLPESPKGAD